MNPAGMAAVFKLLPVNRLLYGSDAPFGSTTVIADHLSKFDLPAGDIAAIRRDMRCGYSRASRHENVTQSECRAQKGLDGCVRRPRRVGVVIDVRVMLDAGVL